MNVGSNPRRHAFIPQCSKDRRVGLQIRLCRVRFSGGMFMLPWQTGMFLPFKQFNEGSIPFGSTMGLWQIGMYSALTRKYEGSIPFSPTLIFNDLKVRMRPCSFRIEQGVKDDLRRRFFGRRRRSCS